MELLLTSLITFIATNIDDLFILTLFYADKRFGENEIIVGQLLGIGALVAISLVASFIGFFVPAPYIGLLGLISISFGLKGIWNVFVKKDIPESDATIQKVHSHRNNTMMVAGVTLANGGDNIAIYIPVFATLNWMNKLTMIGVFFGMTLVFCLLAKYLTRHPFVKNTLDRFGHLITPFILILLGIYILYESGTFGLAGN